MILILTSFRSRSLRYQSAAHLGSRLLLLTSLFFGLLSAAHAHAQSTGSIEGQVTDQQGALVSGVEITATGAATEITRRTTTSSAGRYQFVGLPVGTYGVEFKALGFQTQRINLTLEVARTTTQNIQLNIGDVSQAVTVTTNEGLIENSTVSVGHVVDQQTVQNAPLNGRYFMDLGLLVPGSVTASQTGFSTYPSRGVGALAINTAGNREETTNFMINGITLNNLVFSSISFQPSIDTVQEFKIDNSTFSAQCGQNSGAVVNIATRSGTNQFHGQVFEFFRNDVFDARNFFNFTSSQPPPFKRNQFGANVGGPIIENKLFFFFSYEGLRQRQGLDLNSLVLSDAERAATTNPVIRKLIPLIPRANFTDASGAARFIGPATAPVNTDQWSADISYNLTSRDLLHGYYAIHDTYVREPTRHIDLRYIPPASMKGI